MILRLLAFVLILLPVVQIPSSASAQPVAEASAPPAEVRELLRLLDEPGVRGWLDRHREPETAPAVAPEPAASDQLAGRLTAARAHVRAVAAAVPRLPAEIERASSLLLGEMKERGLVEILLLLIGFVALGYGMEWLFWTATTSFRAWIGVRPVRTVAERLRLVGLRLAYGLSLVTIFGLGSIGAFLVFAWPPLLKTIVLAYLLAVLIVRLALILGRVVLVPGSWGLLAPERYRVLPMPTAHARFWHQRLGLFVGYYAVGWLTVGLLGPLGFSDEVRIAIGYALGLSLLAIAIEAVWRRPRAAPEHTDDLAGRRGRIALNAVLTAYGVLLWLLWVAGLMGFFWLLVVAVLLPKTIAVAQTAVSHITRPSEDVEAPSARRGILEVCLERGLRAGLIVGAALWLAHVWGVDLTALTNRDTLATRLLRGVLTSVVILLLADFLWQVVKAAIDRKLAEAEDLMEPGTEDAVRRARLRTLLPIFRNIFFVVIAILAGLMALSSLGVEIGPLIAGAGVVGVAVGFGAQTLVKDVISGVFYLLDDAFRVGEYIQSGSYKGTVESFSLRSVKLRHQRGPIYTVPFGQLGAVQNMSRDWVIDKFMIGITYDSDLEKARKLIKSVGQELKADPELGRHIMEPLKMQGVQEFGDYAVQIRCKMMTKPGEQFVIRRKAFARIKQLFDANGIKFASPTVQVAGGEDGGPAAAYQALEAVNAAKAASAA